MRFSKKQSPVVFRVIKKTVKEGGGEDYVENLIKILKPHPLYKIDTINISFANCKQKNKCSKM